MENNYLYYSLFFFFLLPNSKTPTSQPAKADTRFSSGRALREDDGNKLSFLLFYSVYIFRIWIHTIPTVLLQPTSCVLLKIKSNLMSMFFAIQSYCFCYDLGCELGLSFRMQKAFMKMQLVQNSSDNNDQGIQKMNVGCLCCSM